MLDMIVNMVMLLGIVAMIQQMRFLMPETGAGYESHDELPVPAVIGQTYWNPQEKTLSVYLPDVVAPRTRVG